jgi:hypothetical protein
MDLIGGPYNNNKEVRLKDIKKYESWAEITDSSFATYVPFDIFDPTLMYDWIQEELEEPDLPNNLSLIPLQLNEARGILIDSRNQPMPYEESIFMERKKRSIFIDYYHQKYSGAN